MNLQSLASRSQQLQIPFQIVALKCSLVYESVIIRYIYHFKAPSVSVSTYLTLRQTYNLPKKTYFYKISQLVIRPVLSTSHLRRSALQWAVPSI